MRNPFQRMLPSSKTATVPENGALNTSMMMVPAMSPCLFPEIPKTAEAGT